MRKIKELNYDEYKTKRICKNCKHFNPETSICNWSNRIELENDWCYSFFKKEDEKERNT